MRCDRLYTMMQHIKERMRNRAKYRKCVILVIDEYDDRETDLAYPTEFAAMTAAVRADLENRVLL